MNWTGRAWLRDAHCVPEYRDAEGEEPHNNWSELLRFRDPLWSAGEWKMILLLFDYIAVSGWWIAACWWFSSSWAWPSHAGARSGSEPRGVQEHQGDERDGRGDDVQLQQQSRVSWSPAEQHPFGPGGRRRGRREQRDKRVREFTLETDWGGFPQALLLLLCLCCWN